MSLISLIILQIIHFFPKIYYVSSHELLRDFLNIHILCVEGFTMLYAVQMDAS